MSDIVDKVSMAIMIEDRCGCTITGTGERVLCDDDRLGGYRQKKCECRDEAKAAIRATLEWYANNVSEGMVRSFVEAAHVDLVDEGYAYDTRLFNVREGIRGLLSQAIKELDD